MGERTPKNVGFTGHQHLTPETEATVQIELARALARLGGHVRGLCSVAEGSDQIFAECVLSAGGELVAVIPAEHYESTFVAPEALANFRRLLAKAGEIVTLDHAEPSEQAFWAAGQHVVDASDQLIAVWDGLPASGLGGTADVVAYAESVGRDVLVIWPEGSRRSIA